MQYSSNTDSVFTLVHSCIQLFICKSHGDFRELSHKYTSIKKHMGTIVSIKYLKALTLFE